jgi:hypothetical protein
MFVVNASKARMGGDAERLRKRELTLNFDCQCFERFQPPNGPGDLMMELHAA